MLEMSVNGAFKTIPSEPALPHVTFDTKSADVPPTGEDMRPLDQWRLCVSFHVWRHLEQEYEQNATSDKKQIKVCMDGSPLNLVFSFLVDDGSLPSLSLEGRGGDGGGYVLFPPEAHKLALDPAVPSLVTAEVRHC